MIIFKTVLCFQLKNIYAVANKSHILTKKLLLEWVENVLVPAMPERALLLVDSWSSYADQEAIQAKIPIGKELVIKKIPPKTTGMIQPLDRFFFRMWKDFVKRVTDFVVLHNFDVQIYHRDSILVLQSLIHNQFAALRFIPFIRYSWTLCGYFDNEDSVEFLHPIQYCFGFVNENCQLIDQNGRPCENIGFFRCAHCTKVVCFFHFFVRYHFHHIDCVGNVIE